MDKIWDRKTSKSEVICRWGGDEKTKWPRRTDKRRTIIFFIWQGCITPNLSIYFEW